MKKILLFVLLAAAAIATASCSKEEPAQTETTQTGMVLHATVDQTVATRATLSDGDTWTFAFSQNDAVFVRNDEMSPDKHWMFTKGDDDFSCIYAETTESATNWYAYFPQVIVYLFQQSGKKEDVAKYLYALSGSTASPTTGEDGLSIAMAPQVAILVIDNQKGPIDINVKTDKYSWVHSLKAKTGSAGFDLVTEETKVSLLTTDTPGTYYIAVPAGVQLCIKDGDTEIKSTITDGFTAGKYYELTIPKPTKGVAKRMGNYDVNWVQLWKDGPKFAEYNVGALSVTDYGGYYCWGKVRDMDPNAVYYNGTESLSGTYDTATNIWGSNWRMPTKEDFDNLLANCDVQWTDNYNNTGKQGRIYTGKGDYAYNSVFFPTAGYFFWGNGEVKYGTGYYWSSTPNNGWFIYISDVKDYYRAYYLELNSNGQSVTSYDRNHGYSIRPVYVGE